MSRTKKKLKKKYKQEPEVPPATKVSIENADRLSR